MGCASKAFCLPRPTTASTAVSSIKSSLLPNYSFRNYPQHSKSYGLYFHSFPSSPLKPLQNPCFLLLKGSSSYSHFGGGGGGEGDGGNGRTGDSDGFFNFHGSQLLLLLLCDDLTRKNDIFNGVEGIFRRILLFLISGAVCSYSFIARLAEAKTVSDIANEQKREEREVVVEIRGGKKIELVADYEKDEFIVPEPMWASWWRKNGADERLRMGSLWIQCRDSFMSLMLPEGFPESVTSDYLEYSLWRSVQGVAAQISGVLATQALLYAIGLGKGAIPTAAAVNWVLKDGIGYLSKIMLSKYGRHFDVNPKGWRLCADLLENAAYGMEILTPAFPHLFVPIGAVAGAGRSASALIQASTRSCFYAGFAAQRNFAEVIAKGEAQGMVSKSVGIMLGIALANCVQSSVPLSFASFGVVTGIHMFCNLKSYQAIQLRTLNPYRAGLVFSEYLLSGLVPSVKEVNDEEPLFPALPFLNMKPAHNPHKEVLSEEAKDAAASIDRRLRLGSKLSDIVKNKEDAYALFELYKNEGYILTEDEGKFCVALKESSSPHDMLKSVFQVSYLYWLEKNAGLNASTASSDCNPGGRLHISLEYAQREFNHARTDGEAAGWVTDGLIARPLPIRVRPGSLTASASSGT